MRLTVVVGAGPETQFTPRERHALLEWHGLDAPIYVAGTISAAAIAAFCSVLGVGPAKSPSDPTE